MRVYHFTPAQHAISNLTRRHLKIARLADLNDPFEHFGLSLEDEELRTAMEATKAKLSDRFGFLCFCRNWQNPIMWSHYADSHRGICLAFEIDYELSPIAYAEERFVIPRDRYADKFLMTTDDMLRIMGTKFKGWEYEEEVRAPVNLDEEEGGLYFKEFDDRFRLVEVILGVRCPTSCDEVAELVAGYGNRVKVTQATLAYGKFELVAAN